MATAIPPNRYALQSAFTIQQTSPRRNTLIPNKTTFAPNRLAALAPTAAPSAVPRNRCQDTLRAAPSDDCVITRVVIGAQYASCSLNNRATRKEATAAKAVRAECTTIGHPAQPTPSRAI